MTNRAYLTLFAAAAAVAIATAPAHALNPDDYATGDNLDRWSWVTERYDHSLFGNAAIYTHPRAWRRSFYGSNRSEDRFLVFTDGTGDVPADRFLKYADGRSTYRRHPRISLPYAERHGYYRSPE